MTGLSIPDTWMPPLTGWASKGSVPSRYATPEPVGSGPVSPNWAIAVNIFSDLTRAYAGYNAARLAKYETKSQASAFGHRARMLELDRRFAEQRAESILDQGQSEIGKLSLEGEQRRSGIKAQTAAAGVEGGVGSAAEVQASEKLIEDIDRYHINLASVREANAARRGATAIGNEAAFSRASSANLRRAARVTYPEANLFAGLADASLSAAELRSYRRR